MSSFPVLSRLAWVRTVLAFAVAVLVVAGVCAQAARADRAPAWRHYLPHPFAVNESVIGVAQTATGGSVVTGRAYRAAVGASSLVVARYDARGRRLWLRYWDDSSADSSDTGEDVVLDAAGNAYILAQYSRAATGVNTLLLKYSPSGRLLWTRRFASPGNVSDYADAITVSPGGTAYVSCDSDSGGAAPKIHVLKYTASGRRVWESASAVPSSRGYVGDLLLDGDGGLYAAGGMEVPGADLDCFVARYSARTGHITWSDLIAGDASGADAFQGLAVHGQWLYASGWVTSAGTGLDGIVQRYVRGSGARLERLVWDDETGADNRLSGIVTDGHGRYWVAAGGVDGGSAQPALFTLRLSNSLGVVWERTLPTGGSVVTTDIAYAGSGRVAVTGLVNGAAAVSTAYAQYKQTGVRRWSAILTGSPWLLATTIAASPNGSVTAGGLDGSLLDGRSVVIHFGP